MTLLSILNERTQILVVCLDIERNLMARNTVVPLSNIDRRAPEAGRIRIGIKSGRAMKSIDTFRFTIKRSTEISDKTCILY